MLQNVHFGPYNEIKSGPFLIPQLSKCLKYNFVKQESLEINNWLTRASRANSGIQRISRDNLL